MDLAIMEFLLWVVTIISAWFIGHYFPSYMKKKGENLATKEDIGKITKEIESVRTSIEIGRDAHVTFINERRDMLIKFYDEITSFQYELLIVNFGDFPMDDGQSLFKYQNAYRKAVAEILKAYQRLVIYLPKGSELLAKAQTVTNCAIDSRKVFTSKFGPIKTSALNEQFCYSNYAQGGQNKQEYKAAIDAANKASNEYWKLMGPIVKSFRGQYQSYMTELNQYLQSDEINT